MFCHTARALITRSLCICGDTLVCLSVSACVFMFVFIHFSVSICMRPSVFMSVLSLLVYLSVCLSVCRKLMLIVETLRERLLSTETLLYVSPHSSSSSCFPLDSIMRLMTVWKISGKITRTTIVFNYIIHAYSGVLTILDLAHFLCFVFL